MSDVFLSYKREDLETASRVVRALIDAGIDVWWDQSLASGENWRHQIETALDEARVVVVLWTAASVGPEGAFVRDEARRGMQRNILLPVSVGAVEPPLGFGELQAIRLGAGKSTQEKVDLQSLVDAVRAKVSGDVLRVATQSPPSASGRNVTKWAGVALLIGLTTIAVFVSLAERDPWDARRLGSCDDLRGFAVTGNPHAGEAQALLDRAKPLASGPWVPYTREWKSVVRSSEKPFPSEAEARADAQVRAKEDAQLLGCAPGSNSERFESVDLSATDYDCREDPRGGYVCAASYVAQCRLERQDTKVECR